MCLSFRVALACGGLFCATNPTPAIPAPPEPVDQNAERIVFEVSDDTITAHVQIAYVGSADDFAWVVPVSGVPEVEESSDAVFDALESATALQVTVPPSEPCSQRLADGGDGGGGCGCSEDSPASGSFDSLDAGAADWGYDAGVTVFDHDYTDNYEFHIVGADDTEVLVNWLQENGYNVSANMTPVMDVYNGDEAAFLALKLRDGREASDIVPIAFTYQGSLPNIPIRLTAVAAQPLMGILVFIVADTPYAPATTGSVTCVDPPPGVETFGPGAGSESRNVTAAYAPVATVERRAASTHWLPTLVLLGALAVLRRRHTARPAQMC